MLKFTQFITEQQEHTSADTSLNQVSSGLKHAVSAGLIKPNSINVDNGGGRFDKGKEHVESNVEGAQLHVHDPFNRSEEHNAHVKKIATHNADYVGMHNVLNVIKEPEARQQALRSVKSLMKPKTGIAHITVYEGDKSGNSRMSKSDKGRGSSWQEHRPTSSYVDEIKNVFPEDTHDVSAKSGHIIIKQKNKEVNENLNQSMAEFLQSKGMNAKLTTSTEKKDEIKALQLKRAQDSKANPVKPKPIEPTPIGSKID